MEDASVYVRLSKEAGTSNLSKDGMVKDLKVLAQQHNYNVTAVHIDDGISGAVRDRPQFQEWLEDGRSGKVQAMLTWHADRLTREGVNAAALVLDTIEGKDPTTGKVVRPPVRLLDNKGTDSFGDQTAFRFQFVIAAEIARAERERMKDRNLAAQQRLREKRRFRGGAAPYGYRIVDHPKGGKALEVDPVERAYIRAAADHILRGHSLYATVRLLNDNGSTPRRAKAWSMPSLRAVLIGDPVLGRMSHQGEPLLDPETGLPQQVWQPILTVEESHQLRTILTAPGRKSEPKDGRRKSSRLLSGKLHCSGCDRPMRANRSNGVSRYICANGFQAGQGCEHPVSINADKLDAYIEAEFLHRYGRGLERQEVVSIADSVERAELTDALQVLSKKLIEPGADKAKIFAQIEALDKRRSELLDAPTTSKVEYVETGRIMGEAWVTGDLVARQRLLNWALNDGHITVRPRDPKKSKKLLDAEHRLLIPWRPALPGGHGRAAEETLTSKGVAV